MASAWGLSWSRAWGNAWGAIASAVSTTASAVGSSSRHKKRKLLVVVEIDGVEFRVPYEELLEFIQAQKKIFKANARKVAKKAKKKGLAPKKADVPIIVLKSAPIDYVPQIKAQIDNNNEIIYTLWRNAVMAYMQEIEEEEILLLMA